MIQIKRTKHKNVIITKVITLKNLNVRTGQRNKIRELKLNNQNVSISK